MADVHAFPKNGVFTIGSGMAGAPMLKALLSTDVSTGQVTGSGILTQAVNPPLHVNTNFSGWVHTTGYGPAKQFFALHGTAPSGLMGASHISSLLIALDSIWGTEGKASFVLFNDTPTSKFFEDLPVKVEWLLLDK